MKESISQGEPIKIFTGKEKNLVSCLQTPVLKAVDYDLDHTVFSYIPNTAESAFYGLIKGVENYLNQVKMEKILSKGMVHLTERNLRK